MELSEKKELLKQVVSDDQRIVAAWAVGSTVWETAAPDSDIDLRFVYVNPVDWYLTVSKSRKRLAITKELRFGGESFDIQGIELQHFLGLLVNSNLNILEQVHSPLGMDFGGERDLINLSRHYYSNRPAFYQYRGLAKNMLEMSDSSAYSRSRVKRLLVAARASVLALCASRDVNFLDYLSAQGIQWLAYVWFGGDVAQAHDALREFMREELNPPYLSHFHELRVRRAVVDALRDLPDKPQASKGKAKSIYEANRFFLKAVFDHSSIPQIRA